MHEAAVGPRRYITSCSSTAADYGYIDCAPLQRSVKFVQRAVCGNVHVHDDAVAP
jgi:hypothetical protein